MGASVFYSSGKLPSKPLRNERFNEKNTEI